MLSIVYLIHLEHVNARKDTDICLKKEKFQPNDVAALKSPPFTIIVALALGVAETSTATLPYLLYDATRESMKSNLIKKVGIRGYYLGNTRRGYRGRVRINHDLKIKNFGWCSQFVTECAADCE